MVFLACAAQTKITKLEFFEDLKDPLIPFIPKLRIMASITENENRKYR